MQCSGCGQSLTSGVSVCLHCGTPVPPAFEHGQVAATETPEFPLLPDPVLPSGDNWPFRISVPTSPYGPLAATEPPPPPLFNQGTQELYAPPETITKPHAWRRIAMIVAMVALLVIMASVGTSVVLARRSSLNRQSDVGDGGLGGKTSNSKCLEPTVDPTAAAQMSDFQLTTGLRDPDHKVYQPVDDTTIFKVGNAVYVTFTLLTPTAGTLTAVWCLGNSGELVTWTTSVPQGSKGAGVYVSLDRTDSRAVGLSLVTIRWNNAVVTNLHFTVTQ